MPKMLQHMDLSKNEDTKLKTYQSDQNNTREKHNNTIRQLFLKQKLRYERKTHMLLMLLTRVTKIILE